MVKAPVYMKSLTMVTPLSYSLISYTSELDCLRKAMILDPNNAELRDIDAVIRSIANAKKANDFKTSWTAKLLSSGKCAVLKKVNEEVAELALAACAQHDSNVILEAADLIYHVVLVLLPLDIDFESLMDIFKAQANAPAQINSLGALEHLAVRCYNRMVTLRNKRLLRNYRVESVIVNILDSLYCNVFRLSFLGARINISTYVSKLKVKDAVYNILYSVLLILHYRNLSYQNVVDELYSRMNVKLKTPKPNVKT
ncbi:MAG: phosphoribosyl-ATP diphosphatase [Candidatus Hodgkinia cicadicola]